MNSGRAQQYNYNSKYHGTSAISVVVGIGRKLNDCGFLHRTRIRMLKKEKNLKHEWEIVHKDPVSTITTRGIRSQIYKKKFSQISMNLYEF